MKRRLFAILALVLIISSFMLTTVASSVVPRYNNTAGTTTNFVISNTGKASISAVYNAYPSYFSKATITSYIEKRTLGLFWTKVDIGQPNNEWVDTSTDIAKAFLHEFQLNSTGTYRATVVYEISGSGGATDVIDYEQERTYS